MGQSKTNRQLSIIVPAYNEAGRIENVLNVLTSYKKALEIIVIDDGSTDDTATAIKQFKTVKYIRNEMNLGKGLSMDKAVGLAKSEYIFFCDADITGLTHEAIDQISKPVFKGEIDMFIAVRNRKMYNFFQSILFIALVGGERVITKDLWNKIPSYYKHKFRIEAGMNFYARHYGKGFHFKIFDGLGQIIKEEKYGLVIGLKRRIFMHIDILIAQIRLRVKEMPADALGRRYLNLFAIQSMFGLIFGFVILFATVYGPLAFVNTVFAEQILEGDNGPVINWLIKITSLTAASTFAIIGAVVLIANLIALIWVIEKLGTLMLDFKIRIANNKTTD